MIVASGKALRISFGETSVPDDEWVIMGGNMDEKTREFRDVLSSRESYFIDRLEDEDHFREHVEGSLNEVQELIKIHDEIFGVD